MRLSTLTSRSVALPLRRSARTTLRVRSSSQDPWSDPLKKAASFAEKLRNDLPVIGLIAKLTTPTGVTDETGLSYQEFSRSIYDTIDETMNDTCYQIQRDYGDAGQLRFMLCVMWMARNTIGAIPPKSIVKAATRLRGSRDLEYEIGQFEALREEEKQKYGYGEPIEYATGNVIPTALDALVRLVLGVTETCPIEEKAEGLLTSVILHVFPGTRLSEVRDAFEKRSDRAYLYE